MKRFLKNRLTCASMVSVISCIFFSGPVFSQNESLQGDDIDVIQVELDHSAPQKPELIPESKPAAVPATKNVDFSTLGRLSPFREVTVLQRKFLPKTGRFQLHGALGLIANDPFFSTTQFSVRAGYFFIESLSAELTYMGMQTTQRQVVKDLKEIQGVTTDNLVTPKSYVGLNLMYVPFYGKMTYKNQKIIPFDWFFTAGYGTTAAESDSGKENVGTFSGGTGQLFALSKSFALRWDLTWNRFNSTGIDGSKQAFNNLFVTIGGSFFFPEATYR